MGLISRDQKSLCLVNIQRQGGLLQTRDHALTRMQRHSGPQVGCACFVLNLRYNGNRSQMEGKMRIQGLSGKYPVT